jgi:hypothetical protein
MRGAVFYVFLVILGLLGIGIYVVFMMREVPGIADQRIGRIVLPDDVGKWKSDEDSPQARDAEREGLKREVRFFWDGEHGLLRRGRLLKQVRYRNRETNAIERTEPDEVVKLKRVRG